MKTILVFDADNTLWDTNQVFQKAQLGLLQVLADEGLVEDPESEIHTLRDIDRAIYSKQGCFEYDFEILATGLVLFYKHQRSIAEVAAMVFEGVPQEFDVPDLTRLAKKAAGVFQKQLKHIPQLFKDTKAILPLLQSLKSSGSPLVTLLLSEGNMDRISKILESHTLDEQPLSSYFDDVIICPTKSKDVFEAAKQKGLQHFSQDVPPSKSLCIAVGDSLKRDIKLGNQAGYYTIYKSGGFWGSEKSLDINEKPAYSITSLLEIYPKLEELGAVDHLPIHTNISSNLTPFTQAAYT